MASVKTSFVRPRKAQNFLSSAPPRASTKIKSLFTAVDFQCSETHAVLRGTAGHAVLRDRERFFTGGGERREEGSGGAWLDFLRRQLFVRGGGYGFVSAQCSQ